MLSLVIALALLGPTVALASPDWQDPDYRAAVEDAKVATADEISRDLTAITASEPDLIWEGEPGRSRILVVSWVSKDEIDASPGTQFSLAQDATLWVTVAPQVKEFFAQHSIAPPKDPTLRIEQLLGMPPHSGCTQFVEAWVDPRDLFRPSPDPEISDHEATLDFPTTSSAVLTFSPTFTLVENVNGKPMEMSYPEWFTYRRATVYTSNEPYPWTGLGYTYDWDKGGNHIGLSEFIVRGEATIGIQAVVPTASYFVALPPRTSTSVTAAIPVLIWVVIGVLILAVLVLSFTLYWVVRRKIMTGR